jgi:HD-GYP domain-containing protein (c-di-GMP phosphodiesterase class II)
MALERVQMIEAKDTSIKEITQRSGVFSDLQLLYSDIAKRSNADEIISLSLIGTTSRLGLGYTRSVFLKYEGESLIFQFGIGPIKSSETASWESDTAKSITEYYSQDTWFKEIVNNNISRFGRFQPPIRISEIPNSIIVQSIKNLKAFKGYADDDFVKTSLANSLRIENEFVASPVFSQGIVDGVVIADKTYLRNVHISAGEITNLLFLTAFAGSCSVASRTSLQLRTSPVQFLVALHDFIQLKYHGREIDTLHLVDLTESIAKAMNLSEEEISAAKVAAIAVNLTHMFFPDSILFGEGQISKEDPLHWHIFKHPEAAGNLIRKIGGPEISAASAYDHHVLFNGYPHEKKNEISEIAKILAISESYLALTNPKKYKKTPPKTSQDAIMELSAILTEEEKKILNALSAVKS